jgi:hypothetical protein
MISLFLHERLADPQSMQILRPKKEDDPRDLFCFEIYLDQSKHNDCEPLNQELRYYRIDRRTARGDDTALIGKGLTFLSAADAGGFDRGTPASPWI